MKIRVGHLYPEYLNIYADRGNIAVLAGRAGARGHELEVVGIGLRDPMPPGIDLFYVGGGQDREQELIAPDLAARAEALREAAEGGAVFLAVCGGYQLLGRSYRDTSGTELPGAGLLPLHTVAGERRMIGDVLLDCAWAGETLAGFENHAGRTILDPGAEPARPRDRRVRERRRFRVRGLPGRPDLRDVPPRAALAAQSVARGPAALGGARRGRARAAA